MATLDLKIGVWPEKSAWSNKILWLFQDEFGYPSELITKNIHEYPVVIVSYKKFIENLSTFSSYLRQGGSALIVCTSKAVKETAKEKFLENILPVTFGDACHQVGHYRMLDNGNPLLAFFPLRRLHPEERRDFNLTIMIRKVHVFPPANTMVEFETAHGDRYPLLVCGKVRENGRFAIITANEDILECRHSSWGPLIYLTALEWCVMDKPFVRKWHWPNAKRITAILTFDFETLSKYSNMRRYWWWHRSFDRFLLGLGLRPILKFLTRKKLRSTWFILGSQAIHTPNLVKKLASSRLIEIAGHGDVHKGIDKLAKKFNEDDRAVQRERLQRMMQTINRIASIFVKGFRAPGLYANYDTLMALQESGFCWDCSASPQTDYSMRWFFLPYYPIIDWESKRALSIVELPVIGPWDRWCPVHGSFHSPKEYEQEILEDFNLLYSVGGLQTLLIHPYQIAVRTVWWRVIESFITKILQLPDVAISSCGEVCSGWVLRREMHIEAMYNVDTSTIHVKVENAKPGLSLMVRIPEGHSVLNVLLNDVKSVPFKFWEDFNAIIFTVDVEGAGRYTVLLRETTI